MGERFRVTIRVQGVTQKSRHATLDEALDALTARLRAEADARRRAPTQERHALRRTYAPVAQVAARGELAGPGGLRAGVDVRGDGSVEAFTGRIVRQIVDRHSREDAFAALARVLAADA
jgi:hypothetical protein